MSDIELAVGILKLSLSDEKLLLLPVWRPPFLYPVLVNILDVNNGILDLDDFKNMGIAVGILLIAHSKLELHQFSVKFQTYFRLQAAILDPRGGRCKNVAPFCSPAIFRKSHQSIYAVWDRPGGGNFTPPPPLVM